MQSTNIIITLWVRWNKTVKLVITLDPGDVEGAQDIGDSTADNCIMVEMPFNNQMTELFVGSNIEELMQHMFVYIKIQIENP